MSRALLITADVSTRTLADLVQLARAGDAAGIGGLYDRYAARLYRTALRLGASVADAEDAVQDLFVGLPEALARYDERDRFDAWLTRVLVRVALMRARAVRRRHVIAIDDELPARNALRPDVAFDHGELQRAIDALPDELRTVFVLKQLEGYDHREIAALLGISVGASRVRLTRALARLRRSLS